MVQTITARSQATQVTDAFTAKRERPVNQKIL